jgi:cytochrome P450 family 6
METLSFKSVFLGVFAVLLVTVYFYFRRKYSYWKNKGVAYLKPSFPFGNFADIALFRKSFGETYAEQYKKLTGKRFGGIYILNRPQLLVRDPDLIKNLLVKDFDHFHDHAFASDEKIDPLSGNLFMLTGSKWRELRTKLSPTFTSGKMKMMFETLTDCGMELREHVRETTEQADMLEIREVLARFSTDVIASCAFGIKCNCLKNPDAEFRQWGKKIFTPTFETITRGLLYMLMPSIAIGLKISSSPKEITKFFRTMVQETVAYRQKYSVNRNDFLQLLIRLMNKQTHESDDPVEQLNGSKYYGFCIHNSKLCFIFLAPSPILLSFWPESLRERNHFGDLAVDGNILR